MGGAEVVVVGEAGECPAVALCPIGVLTGSALAGASASVACSLCQAGTYWSGSGLHLLGSLRDTPVAFDVAQVCLRP